VTADKDSDLFDSDTREFIRGFFNQCKIGPEVLTTKERDVLRLRCGLDDDRMRTISEIAELFGVSEERIQAIEREALKAIGIANRSEYGGEFTRE
jgi:DNA-directed RNA polymerase sigma subunit (sigma70/sigma32)